MHDNNGWEEEDLEALPLEEDEPEDFGLEGPGCLYPDRCLMPGFHYPDECHTQEMLQFPEESEAA